MNVQKIVIASTLKPVNDTRMYEKIGISLGKDKGYEVHVAGYEGKIPDNTTIYFHPLYSFKRLSRARVFAPYKFLKLLFKIKPSLIIVCTYELLKATNFYRLFFKCKVIYDVQENYYSNIVHNKTYPLLLRLPLAWYVRLDELLSQSFINYYLLAEKIYEKELGFTKGKRIVLENKYKGEIFEHKKARNDGEIRLIYTGTIAEEYGVFEAIELTKKLHNLDSTITLTITGYSPSKKTVEELKKAIEDYSFITLKGGSKLIPHHEILEEIKMADFGLICYRANKSTQSRVPTKLYEYLALQLPIILQKNTLWEEKCTPYNASLVINYRDFNAENLLVQLKTGKFYGNPPDNSLLWENEEEKLLTVVKKLI